jgi:hypothetical protein
VIATLPKVLIVNNKWCIQGISPCIIRGIASLRWASNNDRRTSSLSSFIQETSWANTVRTLYSFSRVRTLEMVFLAAARSAWSDIFPISGTQNSAISSFPSSNSLSTSAGFSRALEALTWNGNSRYQDKPSFRFSVLRLLDNCQAYDLVPG